jgi:hypothetical protein
MGRAQHAAASTRLPDFVEPMQAKLVDSMPPGDWRSGSCLIQRLHLKFYQTPPALNFQNNEQEPHRHYQNAPDREKDEVKIRFAKANVTHK